ncbi:sugar ABC transporter permease [Methyloligella sp. 2.7D]|uniref:carbohydrate ABC transporter permease n=1 Tax=unclassified Methyloligella TaxID=2625955 RepID=UPI00157BD82D|nr:sugar ABC transporter permease [Methyloligella sp. GL2]QKP75997.1 sugar ABC transporter permease [Methyloligella sp. GL2]
MQKIGHPSWRSTAADFLTQRNFILFCIIPLLLFLILTSVIPGILALADSMTAWNLTAFGSQNRFVGLDNYRKLLGDDPQFWGSLGRTALFVLVVVPIEFALGLLIALYLLDPFPGRRLVLTLVMIPTMIAPVVVAMTWRFLMMPTFGLFTYYLRQLGFLSEGSVFSGEISAMATLMVIDIWEWTPFMMLILLSGLSAMPKEPIEAAQMDGASPLQILFHIQIPLLRPLIIVAVLFRSIDASKIFDTIYVLTGGGPGADATESITLFAHKTTFVTWQLGYGAAVCQVLVLFAVIAAALFYTAVARNQRSAS